jgi:small nuclear ribonucleoprotein
MSEVATKILEESLGKLVLLRLRGNRSLRGKLQGFDMHMNLVLEEADDISDPENTKSLGTIIVRGDNVVIVSPSPR